MQAGEGVLNVFDGKHDATYAPACSPARFPFSADRRRRVELRQLNPAVAVWGPHHCDVDSDVVEPDDTVLIHNTFLTEGVECGKTTASCMDFSIQTVGLKSLPFQTAYPAQPSPRAKMGTPM
jgi:hypothetical protein